MTHQIARGLLVVWCLTASSSGTTVKHDVKNEAHKYNISLPNGTGFQVTTGGFQGLSKCLQDRSAQGSGSVSITAFNDCAMDLYTRLQNNVTQQFHVRNIGDLGVAFRNLNAVRNLNRNIVHQLETVQQSFRRIPNVENTVFHRSLQAANSAFKNMSKAVITPQVQSNVQSVFRNLNDTLQALGNLANAGSATTTLPDANQLMKRFQDDLTSIQNVTRTLPRADPKRLREMTTRNFTLLVRNLTRSFPEVMRRAATQGTKSARPMREFVGTLTQNLRNASLSLSANSNSSSMSQASNDLLHAYDGFQLAANNALVALSDLVRGSLALVNPANWHMRMGSRSRRMRMNGTNTLLGNVFRRRG